MLSQVFAKRSIASVLDFIIWSVFSGEVICGDELPGHEAASGHDEGHSSLFCTSELSQRSSTQLKKADLLFHIQKNIYFGEAVVKWLITRFWIEIWEVSDSKYTKASSIGYVEVRGGFRVGRTTVNFCQIKVFRVFKKRSENEFVRPEKGRLICPLLLDKILDPPLAEEIETFFKEKLF